MRTRCNLGVAVVLPAGIEGGSLGHETTKWVLRPEAEGPDL